MLVREDIPTGSLYLFCLVRPFPQSKIPKVTVAAGSARCLLPCCHRPSPSPRASLSPLGMTFSLSAEEFSRLYPACMAERVASSSPTRADSGRMVGVALSSPSMSRGRTAFVPVKSCTGASVPFRSAPLRSVPCRGVPCCAAPCRAMLGAQSGQWLICQRE